MQPVSASSGNQPESNLRPQNPNLHLRQEAYEQSQETQAPRKAGVVVESQEMAPSPYMMLISRIDAMLNKGKVDQRTLDQLQAILSERIGGFTAAARRNLLEMPSAKALELDSAAALPGYVSRHLRDGRQRDAVMELLRNPVFAAAMKDESRTATYGPRGYLRAS